MYLNLIAIYTYQIIYILLFSTVFFVDLLFHFSIPISIRSWNSSLSMCYDFGLLSVHFETMRFNFFFFRNNQSFSIQQSIEYADINPEKQTKGISTCDPLNILYITKKNVQTVRNFTDLLDLLNKKKWKTHLRNEILLDSSFRCTLIFARFNCKWILFNCFFFLLLLL